MKSDKIKSVVALLLCLALYPLQAQVATPTAGGNAMGTGGTASYSIGQVAYTVAGSNGSVAQGAQQPYIIAMITGLEGKEGITLHYDAYPNPTTRYLTLKVDDLEKAGLLYQLYDLNGKQLENKTINATETSIDMSNREQAIYLLKVIESNREVKVFKILKIN